MTSLRTRCLWLALLLWPLGVWGQEAATDWQGTWHGAIRIGAGALDMIVHWELADGQLSGSIDLPQQGAADLELKNVRAQGDSLHFELHAPVGVAFFDGCRQGERLVGSFVQAGVAGSFELRPGEPPPPDSWTGSLSIAGRSVGAVLHFRADGDQLRASLDIPAQGALGLVLSDARLTTDSVHFVLGAPQGDAVFQGVVDGPRMTGSFEQLGMEGSFSFERGGEAVVVEEQAVPYRALELAWDVAWDDVQVHLAGTLTLPSGKGPFPAVVLISGSGLQDRDETIFDFKIFKLIADALTRRGIAVLRYDDPGIGGSTTNEPDLTTSELVEPVLGAVDLLAAHPEIDATAIGVCGHSEGGIIAPLASVRQPEIAFCILLSGPALPGETILRAQIELILRASGAAEEEIARTLELQNAVYQALAEEDAAALEQAVRLAIDEQWADVSPERLKEIDDLEAYKEGMVQGQLQTVQGRWFRNFLRYDPAPVLEQLRCPLLALFGEVDLQVPAEPNRRAMREALERAGHDDFTLRVLPQANHLFAPSETGSPSEYATMEKRFVDGFLEQLGDWILAQTQN